MGERDLNVLLQKEYNSRRGIATTYGWGEKLNKQTKNQETFNPQDFTAASYQFPLGSYVRVIDEDSGNSVIVRINDEGPADRSRLIDLSQAAWKALGYKDASKGRTNVFVTPMRKDYFDAPDSSSLSRLSNILLNRKNSASRYK